MVYFPIGYELPETDAEIRTDIKHLIQVLSEFTTKDDRLLAVNKFAAPQTVDFPINAYKSVIEYYFSIGGTYYVEKEQVYITAPTGKQEDVYKRQTGSRFFMERDISRTSSVAVPSVFLQNPFIR